MASLSSRDSERVVQRLRDKIAASVSMPRAEAKQSGLTSPVTPLDWPAMNKEAGEAERASYVWTTKPVTGHYPVIVRPFAALVGKAFLFLAQVVTKPQQLFNTATVRNIHAMHRSLLAMQGGMDRLAAQASSQAAEIAQTLEEMQRRQLLIEKHIEYLELQIDHLVDLDERTDRLAEGQQKLEEQSSRHEQAGAELRQQAIQLREAAAIQARDLADLRVTILDLQRRAAKAAPVARDERPAPSTNPAGDARSITDPLYVVFENRFRGSREEIKTKMAAHLLLITPDSTPVLDLGCGRGEWLELLKERSLPAKGVDANPTMAAECRRLGLDVVCGDLLESLRSVADGSLGAVTAFHVVEHLPFEELLALLDEARRALRPGGILLLETPNPENVIVGSNTFYMDPTHRHPIPPPLLKFLAEQRGFTGVEVRYLHPVDPTQLLAEDSATAKRFNSYFYGPQDYAVVGTRL